MLLAFCLVKAEAGSDVVGMHPLVATALQNWASKRGEGMQTLHEAIESVSDLFPSDGNTVVAQSAHCSRLFLHAQKLSDRAHGISELQYPLIPLLDKIALYLYSHHRYHEAAVFHRQAVNTSIAHYGEQEHVKTRRLRRGLVITLLDLGSSGALDEAESLLTQLREFLERRPIGSKEFNEERLYCSRQTAFLLSRTGRRGEALSAQRGVYQSKLEMFREDHEQTLDAMRGLSVALWRNCGYDEAETIARDNFEKQLRSLKQLHLLTLHSVGLLARILIKCQKFKEAEKYVLHAKLIEDEIYLPTGHPDRLYSARIEAEMYKDQEEYELAETVLRQAQRDGKSFDPKSERLARIETDLAEILDLQGCFQEAESIMRGVLERKLFEISPLDGSHGYSVDIFECILYHLGNVVEAENHWWRLLQCCNKSQERDYDFGKARRYFTNIVIVLGIDENLALYVNRDKTLQNLALEESHTKSLEVKARERD